MTRQFRSSNYMPKIQHNGVAQEDFLKATGKDGEGAIGIRCTSLCSRRRQRRVRQGLQGQYNYEPATTSFGYNSVTCWARP
jgi:hypothetical protein